MAASPGHETGSAGEARRGICARLRARNWPMPVSTDAVSAARQKSRKASAKCRPARLQRLQAAISTAKTRAVSAELVAREAWRRARFSEGGNDIMSPLEDMLVLAPFP